MKRITGTAVYPAITFVNNCCMTSDLYQSLTTSAACVVCVIQFFRPALANNNYSSAVCSWMHTNGADL